MQCPVMVQLIKKLDIVRAEQCHGPGTVQDTGEKKRLRKIEVFLDHHEQTCPTCKQINPFGTGFVEHSSRWGF